jgi:hypothetical protein
MSVDQVGEKRRMTREVVEGEDDSGVVWSAVFEPTYAQRVDHLVLLWRHKSVAERGSLC